MPIPNEVIGQGWSGAGPKWDYSYVGRGQVGLEGRFAQTRGPGEVGPVGRWRRTNRKVTNYGAEFEAAENDYRVWNTFHMTVMFRIQERKAILLRNWPNNEKIYVGLVEGGLRGDFGGGGDRYKLRRRIWSSRITTVEAFQMTVTFGIHESKSILLRNCPPPPYRSPLLLLSAFFLSLSLVCVFLRSVLLLLWFSVSQKSFVLWKCFSGRFLYVFSRCDLESVARDIGVLRECDSMRCGRRSIKSKKREGDADTDTERERERELWQRVWSPLRL